MKTKAIIDYLVAGFPWLYVETYEAERFITELLDDKDYQDVMTFSWQWDCVRGISSLPADGKADKAAAQTMNMFDRIRNLGESERVLLHNLQIQWAVIPPVAQAVLNLAPLMKAKGNSGIIIGPPNPEIPAILQKAVTIVDFDLPESGELYNKALRTIEQNSTSMKSPGKKALKSISEKAVGLIVDEFDNALALSYARDNAIKEASILEMKASHIKKSSTLEIYESPRETFTNLAGLEIMKEHVLATAPSELSKGILLVGVPGCGKSHFGKALGGELGWPTVRLDMGRVFGGIVGQSERQIRDALAVVDAMAPCVLFIDEIEKGLAGSQSSGQTDSGVTSRVVGTFLTWLQDHESKVYVVATCNDISKMPPEFSRAGRWDAVFFIDLPTHSERQAIASLYRKKYGQEKDKSMMWATEGWTGAEIEMVCRTAKMRSISLEDASKFVIPLNVSRAQEIAELRGWAQHRTVRASAEENQDVGQQGGGQGRKVLTTAKHSTKQR